MKRIIGILLLIAGIICLLFSDLIKKGELMGGNGLAYLSMVLIGISIGLLCRSRSSKP